MTNKWHFVVPEETLPVVAAAMVVAFINSIHDGWGDVSGVLCAPTSMINSGEALSSTRLVFSSSIHRMIDATNSVDGRQVDVYGILFEGKNPAEVRFGRDGFDYCETLSDKEIRKVACRFIQMGYRGRINCSYNPNVDETLRFLSIFLPSDDKPTAPCSIHLEWKKWWQDQYPEDYGKFMRPLLEICNRLGLRKPVPA